MCWLEPRYGDKPAHATLNVADWQGAVPPPLDPKGRRAGIGAAEDGGRLRNPVPVCTDGRPAAGGGAATNHRGEPVARDLGAHQRGALGVEGAEPLVSPAGDMRSVATEGKLADAP